MQTEPAGPDRRIHSSRCCSRSSAPSSDRTFEVSLGPVFSNLLLADEINRAPAKVQSALLEVMQERQVTIGRETFVVEPAPAGAPRD
ncbi:AAA family ATPase, partial [Streptobacillus moniliformis]|uniref:AAA family ATPase n=1 Tax=Streptobacillus moniliformis TaxID=34105 RepID=UPI003F683BFA